MARFTGLWFCERVIVDAATNNVSIFNILDEIHPQLPSEGDRAKAPRNAKPAVAFMCSVVSFWARDDIEKPERRAPNVRVQLRSPKGKKLIEVTHQLDLATYPRARLIANLPALPVPEEGVYQWSVALETTRGRWSTRGRTDYVMTFLKSAEEAKQLEKRAQDALAGFKSGGRSVTH